MADLAHRVPPAMEEVFDETCGIDGADELRPRMLGPIANNCEGVLAAL